MIRTLQDLTFRVHSPSCYELISVRHDVEDDAQVFVLFAAGTWAIHYRSAHTNVCRPFKTRDAAIALIRDRAP